MIRSLRALVAALVLALAPLPVLAQQVANHAVPIGKGPGVIGFSAAAAGASGTLFLGKGTSTDPAFVSMSQDCTIVSTGVITCTKTNNVAFAASATTDTTNASNISSGTLAAARGGAGTVNGALKGNGAGVVSQAACADLSNAAASCSTDATNASNITAGTLAAARGGAGIITGALKGNGAGVVSQAACADLSNAAASCSTDATNANNISSGLLAVARGGTGIGSGTSGGIPYYSGSTAIASSAALAANQLVIGGGAGVAPSTLGSLGSSTAVLHGGAGAPSFGAVVLTTDVSGILPIANGGTASSTAAGARSSSGLNLEAVTTHGDSNYSIAATDRTVTTSATLTAPRTWTLPAANSVNPGQTVHIRDHAGGVSGTNTLTIAAAGADTINGASSAVINSQYGGLDPISDGVSKWTFIPAASGGGSGTVTSITAGFGLVGGTITTSGTLSVPLVASFTQANLGGI